MEIDLWLVFLGGLLSTGHCLGMCGGLIAAYSISYSTAEQNLPFFHRQRWLPHLLYNCGRLGTYVTLGAIAGLVGSLVDVTGRLVGIGGMLHFLSGGIMLLIGLSTLEWLPRWGGEESAFSRLIRSLTGRWLRGSSPWRALPLGVITGLLPCGLHWAFQVKAASSGSVLGAMAVMLAFGLGTLLPLLAFGMVSTLMGQTTRLRLAQMVGILILVLAAWEIYRGAMMSLPAGEMAPPEHHHHHG